MVKDPDENGVRELRASIAELKRAVDYVRDQRGVWQPPSQRVDLPAESSGWNFTTFEKFINQRFTDFALQLRERYEAQQTGVTAALAAAEKAVTAALIAAEKAVDKAEAAQKLRNETQNEWRDSLSDLSRLMWTIKEGQAAIDSLRRELLALCQGLGDRVGVLERGYANIQGKVWGVSALFAIVALAVSVGIRFIGHD